MNRFRFGPAGGHPSNPWFRIGEFDVGTTVLAIGLTLISFIAYAIDKVQLLHIALVTGDVRGGEVWRLLTWPLFNRPTGWAFISLILFYIWGTRLEDDLGRKRMAWLLLWMTLVPAVILSAVNAQPQSFGGMRWIGVAFFVAFAVEYPNMRFFFNIPSWVIAAGFVFLDVLSLLGDRFYEDLLLYALVIATAVFCMRQFGLADAASFIPRFRWPGMKGARPSAGRSGGRTKKPKRKKSKANLSAVPDFTPPRPSTPTIADREVDELLDKIAAHGLDSLTPDERRRLDLASKRMRGERD